ncbi:Glutathione S-transferase kappa 1 OS=Mus musculus GN=Gstk1 PE=1 SV=3 [Rhizoctonia solani AG-1 IB]|uniref:Glutathione S-transferase kappa n=1 Tax=Thanatephorus cucumeris (strain AG1-IB / isolate 7/3/14) TaxID=1108050 RepID=A0A0B7FNW9_THACB|nr:Glutathione S-transferase kappa 1 OS=Mus musculus GN=Gstk1 PE=1 SV=3 [Rhizoctonia solani AG-1 IB]
MAPPRISIKLCYDIVSPYSYLAFESLTRYRDLWNIDLELCPYFLGGVMVAANNRPPMSVKLKGHYLSQEIKRLGEEAGLNITVAWINNPPNTMGVARFLRAYKEAASPAELENVTRRLFVEMFSKETPPSDPAFFGSLIPDLISEDKFKEILARSGSQEIKDLVKTESASLVKEYGTFGFPWIIVRRGDGSTGSFFGSDRFANMAWWLGSEYKWQGPRPDVPKSKL